jgi:hypothetical protein
MSVDVALGLISGATGLVALAGEWGRRRARREEEKAAHRFKEGEPELSGENLHAVNEYLFRRVGRLSLREYATDQAARELVRRSVESIDELLEPVPRDAEEASAASPHITAAEEALDQGEVRDALARMRLGIDLDTRRLAEENALMTVSGVSPVRVIRPLVKVGAIAPSEADDLSMAIRVANGAIRGEYVDPGKAENAVQAASRALNEIAARADD